MKTNPNLETFFFKYNEYIIVLNANDDTSGKIISIKNEFSEEYKTPPQLFKPQMLLVNFIHLQMIEERILNHLKNISSDYNPFLIKLKDYGSLPTHTIFINVETKQQVQNLVKKLKSVQRLITLDKENKPHYIDNVYFTIATKLLPWQYEKAWLEYTQRHFTASFIASGFTVLKRPVSRLASGFQSKGSYKILQHFEFTNSSVISKQGEIFI